MQIIGYIGTAIAVIAYLPQIIHLIKEKCSAGISVRMYVLWIASSILLFIHAVSIHSIIFIVSQLCNLTAVSIIATLARLNKDKICAWHQKHPGSS